MHQNPINTSQLYCKLSHLHGIIYEGPDLGRSRHHRRATPSCRRRRHYPALRQCGLRPCPLPLVLSQCASALPPLPASQPLSVRAISSPCRHVDRALLAAAFVTDELVHLGCGHSTATLEFFSPALTSESILSAASRPPPSQCLVSTPAAAAAIPRAAPHLDNCSNLDHSFSPLSLVLSRRAKPAVIADTARQRQLPAPPAP